MVTQKILLAPYQFVPSRFGASPTNYDKTPPPSAVKEKNIPVFPEFRGLRLQDQQLFQEIFRNNPVASPALNFVTLFTYRESLQPRITSINGNMCVLVDETNGEQFLEPVGDKNIGGTIQTCMNYLHQNKHSPMFGWLSESFVKEYALDQDERYSVIDNKDHAHYVYERASLAFLPGRNLAKKRNLIKQLTQEHVNYKYAEITPNNLQACINFAGRWFDAKKEQCKNTDFEKSVHELLGNFSSLEGLKGALLSEANEIFAITIGKALTPEMAIVYLEMADQNIKGSAQTINQLFCQNTLQEFAYIDREEDMGIPALRQAKESYAPCFLIKMFDLTPSNGYNNIVVPGG